MGAKQPQVALHASRSRAEQRLRQAGVTMTAKYASFTVDTPGQLDHWTQSFDKAKLFALVDFESLDDNQRRELNPNAVNLYDDLAGTKIAELGPRLLEIEPATQTELLERCLAGYPAALLLGQCSLPELASHLQDIREVLVPEDTHALFRYQDAKVIRALFPIVLPAQSKQILGPLQGWGVLDACRTFHTLTFKERHRKHTGPLRFDQKLVTALDDQLFIHTIAAQIRETDSALLSGMSPCEVEMQIRSRLKKAEILGLEQRPDLSFYCVLSFQFPEGFEALPPFAGALRYRENHQSSFGDMLDYVPSEIWAEWDERLKKENN